jgi:hypothetical protein
MSSRERANAAWVPAPKAPTDATAITINVKTSFLTIDASLLSCVAPKNEVFSKRRVVGSLAATEIRMQLEQPVFQ